MGAREDGVGMRVIIADASPFTQRWLAAALAPVSGAVVFAPTGLDLLFQLADRGPFHLVVTQGHLPGLGGAQVLAMARTAGDTTPFVLLSAVAPGPLRELVNKTQPAVLVEDPLDANAIADAARSVVQHAPVARRATWRPPARLLRALGCL